MVTMTLFNWLLYLGSSVSDMHEQILLDEGWHWLHPSVLGFIFKDSGLPIICILGARIFLCPVWHWYYCNSLPCFGTLLVTQKNHHVTRLAFMLFIKGNPLLALSYPLWDTSPGFIIMACHVTGHFYIISDSLFCLIFRSSRVMSGCQSTSHTWPYSQRSAGHLFSSVHSFWVGYFYNVLCLN